MRGSRTGESSPSRKPTPRGPRHRRSRRRRTNGGSCVRTLVRALRLPPCQSATTGGWTPRDLSHIRVWPPRARPPPERRRLSKSGAGPAPRRPKESRIPTLWLLCHVGRTWAPALSPRTLTRHPGSAPTGLSSAGARPTRAPPRQRTRRPSKSGVEPVLRRLGRGPFPTLWLLGLLEMIPPRGTSRSRSPSSAKPGKRGR